MLLTPDNAARTKTYQLLAEGASFPNHDSKRVLEAFRADTNVSPDSLKKLVANATQNQAPSYFLAWDKNTANCHILHRPMMQMSTAGEVAQPYHDTLHLLRGDVTACGDLPHAVTVTSNLFGATDVQKVPLLAAWRLAEATEDEATEWVAPVDPSATDLATNDLKTRKCVPIPKELVSLFWKEMTPRVALRSVCDRIDEIATDEAHKLTLHANFQLFVDHLRVAATEEGRKQMNKNLAAPTALWCGPGRAWTTRTVKKDLQALDPELAPTAGPSSTELMQKLQATMEASNRTLDKVTDLVARGHQGPLQQPSAKTVEAKWPETKDALLRTTGVTSTQQLPEIWKTIARAGKHEVLRAVETLLDAEARRMKLHYRFIVSARFVKALTELRFASKENLETGINIFNSVVLGTHIQQSAAVADYNETARMLESGTISTLGDRKAHQKFKHAVFPQTAHVCRHFIFGYLIVLHVVFGPAHPLTGSYATLTDRYPEVEERLSTAANDSYTRFLAGAHNRLDAYFKTLEPATANASSSLPSFQSLIDGFLFDGVLPVPTWLKIQQTPRVPQQPAVDDSDRTPERDLGQPVRNRHLDASLTITEPTSGMLRLVGPAPKHDDGAEMCLIYHCKSSGCKANCVRKASHRQLTPAEKESLTAYVNQYREKKANA